MQVTSKWQTHSPLLSVETLPVHNLLYRHIKFWKQNTAMLIELREN